MEGIKKETQMKLKFLKAATTSLIMTICSIVSVANATLITDLTERDWKVAGDTAITYDSSTGLEWLDLTQTNGNSILDTEAESFFGEFRWATNVEIEGIFDSIIIGSGFRSSTWLVALQNAVVFQDLLSRNFQGNYSIGVSRGAMNNTGGYGVGYVRAGRIDVYINDPRGDWGENSRVGGIGSWLVRATDVPEPTSLAIFALGMMGLASRRFKQQS